MENETTRDYNAILHEYARQAVADEAGTQFCKEVRQAAQRHLNDIERCRDPDSRYYFDPWYVDDACSFIEELPHVEGVWERPTLYLEPAQIFIIGCIFGWRRRVDDNRRFTYAYIEMARKNAKSTISAAIVLYIFTCEEEVGSQILIGATTGEQAQKVFKPAWLMVQKTPDLQEEFELSTWGSQKYPKSITSELNGGFIQPINSKSSTQDGWNPHCGVLDELHAHKDRGLFDVIDSAFGARKNPFLLVITTAGFDTNGICYEQRQMVCKMLKGAVELEHVFGIIYTLDEGDDWTNPAVWVKANPLLGSACQVDKLEQDVNAAKASPEKQGNIKTKRFNIWLNATSAWLNMEQWKKAADPSLSWEDFEGLDCYIGADLADKDDITAAVLAAFDNDGRLIFKPLFWLPEAVLKSPEHSQGKSPAPYRKWVEQGQLLLTPGDWVDHNMVEDQITEWIERFAVKRVTFDQFAAAQAMASRLNLEHGDGSEDLAVTLHKKASNVTDPAKELAARVKSGPSRLRHDDNEVMNWMASNVVVVQRRDKTILPIKESQMSPHKIDGIDALINAIHPAVLGMEEEESVYESRGVRTLG